MLNRRVSFYTNPTRRTVLRATGGLVGLTGLVDTVAAACYTVEVVAPMADVYDDCEGQYVGCVKEGASGITCGKCYDANGDPWWDCQWDGATPHGWVHDDQVAVR